MQNQVNHLQHQQQFTDKARDEVKEMMDKMFGMVEAYKNLKRKYKALKRKQNEPVSDDDDDNDIARKYNLVNLKKPKGWCEF